MTEASPKRNRTGAVQDAEPFRLRFAGDAMAVRQALIQLRAATMNSNVSRDQGDVIELVLGEVLNNVVEHAYGNALPGEIEMTCTPRGGVLEFTVRDFGAAMPDGRLPAGMPVDLERARDDLPEGGFGWFLVRRLARELHYKRENNSNCLSFCIPLNSYGCADELTRAER